MKKNLDNYSLPNSGGVALAASDSRPEPAPFEAPEERTDDRERHREDDECGEDDDPDLAITRLPRRVAIQVGHGDQPGDDEGRKGNPSGDRRNAREQLLEAQEEPRGLAGVGRLEGSPRRCNGGCPTRAMTVRITPTTNEAMNSR